MSRCASAAAAIATLALSLAAFAPISTMAYAATCNAAPKPTAPLGQHWYYRTDRNLGRKCWYLASEGRKGQATAPKPAATDDDEDSSAEPAAQPMAEAAARLTEPLRNPPPAARPAVDPAIVAQADTPIRVQTESIRSNEPAPVAQDPAPGTAAPSVVPEPSVVDQAPAPAAVPAPAPTRINLMQFVFVAFVGLCLFAGLFIYLAAMRRRRDIRIVDLNTPMPLRRPDMAALTDSPSVAPDVWKRQPA